MATRARRRRGRLTPTQARAARRARRQTRRRLIRFGAFLLVGGIALLFIVALFASNLISLFPARRNIPDGPWERVSDMGAEHIAFDAAHESYNSVPATSGPHYSILGIAPTRWGVHDEPLRDEMLVHNLEHGGVGIHYNCPEGCDGLVDMLAALARRAEEVVMSPYPGMDSTIALTAWNFIDKFDEFDKDRIELFVNSHMNSPNAPEFQTR